MDNDLKYIPPPDKNDVLFTADAPNKDFNALLNPSFGDQEYQYLQGYRSAYRTLIQQVLKNPSDQDFLALPILFLARHHLELTLKYLLLRASHYLGRGLSAAAKDNLKTSHNLSRLWADLKPLLREVFQAYGSKQEAEIAGVESYIRQITEIDPTAQAFRYNTLRGDVPSISPDAEVINLPHFGSRLERLSNYLLGTIDVLSVLEENKQDQAAFEAEAMAEYIHLHWH
jgi:hypothetical protein